MTKEKVSLQERREAGTTLADLFFQSGVTVHEASKLLGSDDRIVMEWICGRIPRAKDCVALSLVLSCPLSEVYKALVNTPCVL